MLGSRRCQHGGHLTLFSSGDRVRVSDDFFWAQGAKGTVSTPPDAVTCLSGAWEAGLDSVPPGYWFTHHVHILEMNGESYRLKDSKSKRPGKPRS